MAASDVLIRTPEGTCFEVGLISPGILIGANNRGKLRVPLYDARAMKFVAQMIKERIAERFDCLVLISGERRTGKSTLAIQLAKTVDDAFALENVAFTLDEFGAILERNPVADPEHNLYPQSIYDESGFDMFYQEWMKQGQRDMVKLFEVAGAKCQIVYFNTPHRGYLNRGLREGMVHFWIHTTAIRGFRGMAELWVATRNKWHVDTFWVPQLAFTFPEATGEFWEKYTTRKMTFIEQATAGEIDRPEDSRAHMRRPLGARAQSWRYQRNILIRELHDKYGLKVDEIASKIKLTRRNVENAIAGDDPPIVNDE